MVKEKRKEQDEKKDSVAQYLEEPEYIQIINKIINGVD